MEITTSEKLNSILTSLCSGIETPINQTVQDTDNNANRLLEMVEEKNYPYPELICPHREAKGIDEDCVDCIYEQYETHKTRFLSLAKEKGENHTHTLKAAFDYYTSLITQYRLTECDQLIDSIYAACLARGKWSKYYISAVQARAFLRFKQGRYQESLEDFHKQIEILGPHDAIYENMALVYSRLNQPKEACAYYARAILLIRQKPHEEQRFSTLLMGLSTALESIDDVLVVLEESLNLLRKRFSRPHSLIAKTLGAIGDAYAKKGDLTNAEKYYAETVPIFIDTCGLDTPLTANAMTKHAKILSLLSQKEKAIAIGIHAIDVWAKVDNISFESNAVFESLNILRQAGQNALSAKELTILKLLQDKITNNDKLSEDLNILCLLKFINEIYIINKAIPEAVGCCQAFSNYLNKLTPTNDLLPIRDQLLQENDELLKILKTI